MRICLTLLALLVTPQLHAAPVPIPADALVVVHLNGRGPVVEHLAQFLAAVQPDAAKDLPKRLQKSLAELAPGRDVNAVPPAERIVGLAYTLDGWNSPTPPWVWLVPVQDGAEFRKKLLTDDERGDFEAGKEGVDRAGPWFLVARPGHVAVSASEEAAKAYHASRNRLTAERLGTLSPVVNESDAAIYVNLTGVNAQYGDAVRSALQFATLLLQNGGTGPIPAFDARQLETVKFALTGVTQALADGRDLAVGLNAGTEGLIVRAEVAFAPGSPTAKQFAADKPVSLDEVLTLPAGCTTYTASRWGPAAAAILRQLTREYQAPPDDERARAAVTTYESALRDGVQVTAGRGSESGSVLATPDAAKLTAAHAKLLRTMPQGGYSRNVLLAAKPGLREQAVEAHGFALHRAELALDLEAGVATIRDPNVKQATLESMKRLVNEKTVLWFGDDGKRYVQLEAATPVDATRVLESLLAETDRVGANAAFQATRHRLPKLASMVLLAEAGPTMTLLADYARSVAGALPAVPGFEVPEFRTLKDPPQSFVGLAVTAQAGRLGMTMFVPAAAAKVAVDSTVIPAP